MLAPLRDEHFTSLAALNEAIARGVKELNDRPFTKMEGSRSERFCQERSYLRPLPETPFSYGRWLSLRVPPSYHLIIGEVSYSVPYVLTGKTVEVRITEGIGRSQQKLYEILISLVSKTLTSGRLRTLFHLLFTWSVDPHLGIEGGWGWDLSYKALGVGFIGVT